MMDDGKSNINLAGGVNNMESSDVFYRSRRFAVLRGEDGELLLAALQPDGNAWSVVRHPPGPDADALLKDIAETNVRDPFQRQWMDQEIANRMDELSVQREPEVLALPVQAERDSVGRSIAVHGYGDSPETDTGTNPPMVKTSDRRTNTAWMAREPEIIDAEYTEISQEPATGEVGEDAPKENRRSLPHLDAEPLRVDPSQEARDASPGVKKSAPDNNDLLENWPGVGKAQRSSEGKDPIDWTPPKPKRIPIGDLRPGVLSPKKAMNPYAPVRFYDERNRHVMTDEGYRLNIRMRASVRENVLLAALREGQERYGEPVRVAGNPVFMARMAKLAIENGIEIAPDGPFKAVAERVLNKDLAKDLGHGTIGGGPEMPEERLVPGKGRINAKVLAVTDDAVVLRHNGREKLLDAQVSPEQRETLKGLVNQPVVLHFDERGLKQADLVQKEIGNRKERGFRGL
jgi:hypothetical protein